MKHTQLLPTQLGDTLEVFQDDFISREIERHGIYAKNELNAWRMVFDAIKPGLCLDIGANIGNHSSFLSRCCTRVHAFEPNPDTYAVLTRNIERNRLNVTPHNFGISDVDGEFKLFINERNDGCSSFNEELAADTTNAVTCKLKRGDDAIEELGLTGIDFIKIDVEGLEGKVVSGMARTIRKFQPVLSIEWNNDVTRDAFTQESLFQKVFPGYHYLCVTHDHDRTACTGMEHIKRFWRKHVLKSQRNAVFSSFDTSGEYDAVLFIPPRFEWIISKLPLTGIRRGTQEI